MSTLINNIEIKKVFTADVNLKTVSDINNSAFTCKAQESIAFKYKLVEDGKLKDITGCNIKVVYAISTSNGQYIVCEQTVDDTDGYMEIDHENSIVTIIPFASFTTNVSTVAMELFVEDIDEMIISPAISFRVVKSLASETFEIIEKDIATIKELKSFLDEYKKEIADINERLDNIVVDAGGAHTVSLNGSEYKHSSGVITLPTLATPDDLDDLKNDMLEDLSDVTDELNLIDKKITTLSKTVDDKLYDITTELGYHETMLGDLDIAIMREVGKVYNEIVDVNDSLVDMLNFKADADNVYTISEIDEQLLLQDERDDIQEDAIQVLYINEAAQNKTILELVEKVDNLESGGSGGGGGTVDLTEVVNARKAMDGIDKGSLSARLEHDYLTLEEIIDSSVEDLGDLIDTNSIEIAKKFDKTGGTINGSVSISGSITGPTITTINSTLNNKSDTNHTHSTYAPTSHTHTKSSITDFAHTHSEYSTTSHNHDSTYSPVAHTHSIYAPVSHSHTSTDLPNSSTSASGIVQLNNTLSSTSVTEALTAAQGKALNDKFTNYSLTSHTHSTYAPTSHTHTAADLPISSTSERGIIQLSDALTSSSSTLALTANQGKVLNDKFSNYLPLTGGSVTGDLDVQGDLDFDNGICHSKLYPNVNVTYDLGESDKRWSNVYGFNGSFTGNFSAGATTLGNTTTGTLSCGAITSSGGLTLTNKITASSLTTTNKTIFQCSSSSAWMYFGNTSNTVMLESLGGTAYINNTNSEILTTSTSSKTWKGTQAEYDAIATKDVNTLYFVKKS